MSWQTSKQKEWCVISYPGESEHLDWKERLSKLPFIVKVATIIHDKDLDKNGNVGFQTKWTFKFLSYNNLIKGN